MSGLGNAFDSKEHGVHECEEFEGTPDVAKKDKKWAACTKNPGHREFIAYPKLRVEHLPQRMQTQRMLNRLRTFADRTVMLTIEYISEHRPIGFPFYTERGTHRVHTGSGWISDIVRPSVNSRRADCLSPTQIDTVRYSSGTCPQCLHDVSSSSGSLVECYEVHVVTACHVVYNDEEARSTRINIFYDDEDSAENGKMKTIWGSRVIDTDLELDTCTVVCRTRDPSIIKALIQLTICSGLPRCDCRYRGLISKRRSACAIVSHPHGQPKQVTFGEMAAFWSKSSDFRNRINYTASTCPGSSGALILRIDDFVCPLRASSKRRKAVHSSGRIQGCLGQGSLYTCKSDPVRSIRHVLRRF